MPVSNLLHPDNRLLAWSTGDFSLYGAQPLPAVTIGNATADVPIGAERAGEQLPPQSAGGPEAAPDLATPSDYRSDLAGVGEDSVGGSSTPPLPDSPTVEARGTTPDSQHSVTPQGGSTAPYLTARPTIVSDQAPDGSTGADAVTNDAAAATGQPLAGILAAAPAAATIDAVTAQLAPVTALLHGATDVISAGAAQVIAAAGTVQSSVVASLDTVGDTLAEATTAVSGVAGDAAALVGDLAGAVGGTVGEVADTVGNAADGVTATTGSIVDAPALDVDQLVFQGSDPAAGISTLVDMVQSSELFSIGPAAATPAPDDASGSIVDDLIGDAAAAVPLLGEDVADPHHAGDLGDLHLGL